MTSLSLVNGRPSLTVSVTKLPAANTVDVSKAVRAALPDLRSALGAGGAFTVVFDQAPFIEQSIESLLTEGLLGLVFAVLVILLFLLSVRATLVTAISIPTSVLITLIGMQAAQYSLNILTLGAITIAIGRVVDDSIVVTENIARHFREDFPGFANDREDRRRIPAEDRRRSVLAAVREVAGAVTASTATTVAVFLPIAFVGETAGELFRPFALTVTIALVASLLVALTIVPVLAYWFLRPGPAEARVGQAPAAAAARLPPGAVRDARAPVADAAGRRPGAGRHGRAAAGAPDELLGVQRTEHAHGDPGAAGRHQPGRPERPCARGDLHAARRVRRPHGRRVRRDQRQRDPRRVLRPARARRSPTR